MRWWVAACVVAFAVAFCAPASATDTRPGPAGTFLLGDARIFPIVISKGPPRDGVTPTGASAIDELVAAGVNFFKVGPATTVWNAADIEDARLWDQAAAARNVHTWVNLSTLSQAKPDTQKHAILQNVINTLKNDPGAPGLGMWKGADEPLWNDMNWHTFGVETLQFAYCLSTSRGLAGWCANKPPLDEDHAWVTIQAPKGTADQLRPYSDVTDTHGVDDYPVAYGVADPDLHSVGRWTSTIVSVTPSKSVWTTLQVCASGSSDPAGSGNFVLPTRLQERYVIYDAIVNGARSVGFYGGNLSRCWNASDTAYEWNWTFWNGVLKSLVQEISAISPIAPALVNADTNQTVATSDPTTQAISRQGATPEHLWVIAARSGAGTANVTISGLPPGITSGTVYTEGRNVSVSNGSFTDTFARWGVHVYHFGPAAPTAVRLLGFTARRERGAVVVRWRTAQERVLGFNLYRGGTKLNRRLIPARATRGSAYSWRDRHAPRAGRTVYRLETVALDGGRSSSRTTTLRTGTR